MLLNCQLKFSVLTGDTRPGDLYHEFVTQWKLYQYSQDTERPLGRPRRRWEDNIRIDLEEIGINAGNWVDSAHDRNYW